MVLVVLVVLVVLCFFSSTLGGALGTLNRIRVERRCCLDRSGYILTMKSRIEEKGSLRIIMRLWCRLLLCFKIMAVPFFSNSNYNCYIKFLNYSYYECFFIFFSCIIIYKNGRLLTIILFVAMFVSVSFLFFGLFFLFFISFV